MQISPTHPARPDLHKHLAGAWLGDWHILDRQRFAELADDCGFHCLFQFKNFLPSVKVKRRTLVGPDPVVALFMFQSPSHFTCGTLIEVLLFRK
jgi:hypothetical protein